MILCRSDNSERRLPSIRSFLFAMVICCASQDSSAVVVTRTVQDELFQKYSFHPRLSK